MASIEMSSMQTYIPVREKFAQSAGGFAWLTPKRDGQEEE
jgi:hypothetical protein